MLIELKDAVKQYGSGDTAVYALDHASFQLEQGKICVILGPSGSGKSTMLNMLGGLGTLDSGTLTVGGKNIMSLTPEGRTDYRKEDVGFVFQFYNLIADLTVEENIQVVADIAPMPLPMDQVLDALEITKYRHRFPRELSGGQQQRVAIARAMIKNPKLYINIETDGTTARVFSPTEKIDRYAVTVGSDVKNPGDVIISEGYAVKNEVSVGDNITIGDKAYTVTGFFQRPDYLYMLENTEDSYKNITTFFLCYMTPEDFDALGDTSTQYLVRYHGASDAFRTAIYDRYLTASYVSAQDNTRISMVEMQAEMFLIMAYILLVTLPLVAVALIAIIISRKVKSEQKLIGTLSALGYKKGQLMRHYAGFAALPGLLGGILTAVISAIAAQPYGELGLQDYEPMRIHCTMNPIATVLGIVAPTAMYVIAALLAVRRLLKHDTVSLLSGSVGTEKKHRRLLAKSRLSVKLKFALRTLLGSPARSFVILLGIFLGSYIALLGFSMVDTINGMVDITNDTVGTYSYEYILNDLSGENDYGGEPMLMMSMESETAHTLSLTGIDPDNPYLNLTTEDGTDAVLGDGCYITSLTALLEDWQTGDTVTLYNPLSMEETTLHIDGIVKNDIQQAAYVTRSHVLLPLGILLSIPAALASMSAFARMFVDLDGMLLTVSLQPKSYLYTIALTCLSYFGSLLVLRRKITKVDMIESLKDNRE